MKNNANIYLRRMSNAENQIRLSDQAVAGQEINDFYYTANFICANDNYWRCLIHDSKYVSKLKDAVSKYTIGLAVSLNSHPIRSHINTFYYLSMHTLMKKKKEE